MAGNIQGVSGVRVDNLTTPVGYEKDDRPILGLSSSGELVKEVQAKVGVDADGVFDQKQRPPCAPSKALMALTLTGLSDQRPGRRWIACQIRFLCFEGPMGHPALEPGKSASLMIPGRRPHSGYESYLQVSHRTHENPFAL
jgi:hypothetical protein